VIGRSSDATRLPERDRRWPGAGANTVLMSQAEAPISVRIDAETHKDRVVLRVHGALVGWEAERLLREQIVAAVEAAPEIVLDLREMTEIDPGCLGAIESGLIGGVYVEGGGPDVQALLRK
jgi:hypothetical protein